MTRTTTKTHPVRLRRAWDLNAGDTVWQDGRQRIVQAMMLAPDDARGDDLPMLHLWFTDAPETHGHRPVIVHVWARAEEKPPAKPKPGVYTHWMLKAVRDYMVEHPDTTLGKLRDGVIGIVETRHPM